MSEQESWRSVKDDPPALGAYVEIVHCRGFVMSTIDKVYWHPNRGNWPVAEIIWRPAKEPAS